jgi:nucleoside-diphosphate-sugar epimerase
MIASLLAFSEFRVPTQTTFLFGRLCRSLMLLAQRDIGDLMRDVGFKPQTSIEDGIRDFVAWYRGHYNV